MNSAKFVSFDEQRQARHPIQHVLGVRRTKWELLKKTAVLEEVIGVMWAQRRPSLRIGRMEVDGIQFVVAHDGLGAPRIHQFAHDPDDGSVFGTSIDKVAQEYDLTIRLRVEPRRAVPPPTKVFESNTQLLGLTVDVGNYVSDAQGSALLIL